MKWINRNTTLFLVRLAIAMLFGYFGFLALREPAVQAGMWIAPFSAKIIGVIMPLSTFMVILGAVQLVVAVAILFGVLFRFACIVGALLVLGIIINLGWGDIGLRDFVVFSALLHLSLKGPGSYRI